MMKQLLLGAVLLALVRCALSAEWHLNAASTAGTGSGQSSANAWTNVAGISWGSIQDGDTLTVYPGEYTGQLDITKKPNLTIRISQDAASQAVFNGRWELLGLTNCLIDGLIATQQMIKVTGPTAAVVSVSSAIRLRTCKQVTLRGVEVDRSAIYMTDGAPLHAISVANSTLPANQGVVIENCWIHHITGDGINISTPGAFPGLSEFMIRQCKINNTMDDAVQASGNLTVEFCEFDEGGEFPKFGGHQDGVQTGIGTKYTRIRNNVIRGYSQCVFIERTTGYVEVMNNILDGMSATSGSGRGIYFDFLSETPDGPVVVANNLMANFLTYYGCVLDVWPADTNLFTIANNVFFNCKRISAGDGPIDSSNVFWDAPSVQYYDTSGGTVSIPSDRQSGSAVNGDPKFLLTTSADYRIATNSVCVGAGVDLSAKFLDDIVSTIRAVPWDSGPHALLTEPKMPSPPKYFRLE